MNRTIKTLLFDHCKSFLESKLAAHKNQIDLLYESLYSETKSSAGDKHETGRALIQLEIEKTGNQLKEVEKNFESLLKINNVSFNNKIGLGSIVVTKSNNYYLAVSAKPFTYQNGNYYCISNKSPIGKLLIGKKTGEFILFNNKKITIIEVL
jgi:transcription elongation GreA/GreB family factor